MRRIQANRDQQGPYFSLKVVTHPFALARGSLPMGKNSNATLLQLRQQHIVVESVLLIHNCARVIVDAVKGIFAVRTVGSLSPECSHVQICTNLKKLI